MTDDEVLAGLIMAARAEREAGFEGWSSPPDQLLEQCDKLCAQGLAERENDHLVHYRPTAEGERVCQIKISRVQ
jgi:hypothetical protein